MGFSLQHRLGNGSKLIFTHLSGVYYKIFQIGAVSRHRTCFELPHPGFWSPACRPLPLTLFSVPLSTCLSFLHSKILFSLSPRPLINILHSPSFLVCSLRSIPWQDPSKCTHFAFLLTVISWHLVLSCWDSTQNRSNLFVPVCSPTVLCLNSTCPSHNQRISLCCFFSCMLSHPKLHKCPFLIFVKCLFQDL